MREEDFKEKLTEEEYRVLREGGTEPPFTGEHVHTKTPGTYVCKACGSKLFSSKDKFDSGSGWPSFSKVLEQGSVELRDDDSHRMTRTEVVCAKCKSHLGHVFDDGPQPTGKRYCINSVCLNHIPEE